jgi:hypothetical protein
LIALIGILDIALDQMQPTALQEHVVRFRSVWSYCILIGLFDTGVWKPEWKKTVSQLASKTPLLVATKGIVSLEAELSANTTVTDKVAVMVFN